VLGTYTNSRLCRSQSSPAQLGYVDITSCLTSWLAVIFLTPVPTVRTENLYMGDGYFEKGFMIDFPDPASTMIEGNFN
jgi:hypothetical protein